MELRRMTVDKLGIDIIAHDPVVILKDVSGGSILPITIGVFEATAIALALEGTHIPRPISHDLIKSILNELEAKLVKVLIYDVKEATFFAKLVLQHNGGEIEIDARPSDSIAIALRMDAPIYVTDNVLESDGIREVEILDPDSDESIEEEDEEEDPEDKPIGHVQNFAYRSFIENLKPSDFSDSDDEGDDSPSREE